MLANLLVARRWPLLAAGLLATAIAWPAAQRLHFDRSIENMFAHDDEVLAPYRQLKRTFGGNEIVLAAYVDRDLLSTSGLDRLEKLTGQLANVPGVATVFSLAQRGLLGGRIVESSLREPFLQLAEGYVIGADRQTAGIVCLLVPEAESNTPRSQTIAQMRAAVGRHDPTAVLTGEPVMIVEGFRYLEHDGRLLGTTSTVLLTLVIVFCFRSLRWVVVPVAIVYATLLWTQAALAASGFRLSMVSSMLWALVTVICVATVVHVIVGFRAARASGRPQADALALTLALLLGPIAGACLTDAAGFGSLLVAHVGPVRDFGAMMALASLLALASIVLLLPGLALAGGFDADPRRAWGEGHLERELTRLSAWIEHHPRTLALAVAVPLAAALVGLAWLEVETDFTKNFRAASPLVKSYEFVETRLGGAGVMDVVLPLPADHDPEFIPRLRMFEERLRRDVVVRDDAGRQAPALTKVMSVVDALDALAPGMVRDQQGLEAALAPARLWMPLLAALHGRDPQAGGRQYLRVMLRARERQPADQKHRLIEQVRRLAREEFGDQARVTGFFVLLARLIESVSRDQWLTFAVATVGIWLMVLAAFRSLPLALISLAPNALPILVVTGMMGWLGLRINMGAAMIASVSMGLSVDSSIHYLAAFRRQRAAGLSLHEALHAVHQQVGRAMIFSTLALVVGFSALCLSEFVPTIYFGVLVSLAMLGGLAGNLVILPLLLKLVSRESSELEVRGSP